MYGLPKIGWTSKPGSNGLKEHSAIQLYTPSQTTHWCLPESWATGPGELEICVNKTPALQRTQAEAQDLLRRPVDRDEGRVSIALNVLPEPVKAVLWKTVSKL